MHYITTNKYKLTEYQNQKNIVYGKAEEKKPLKILKTTFLIFNSIYYLHYSGVCPWMVKGNLQKCMVV